MSSIDFSGTWKLVHTENLDGFLKACGVGIFYRAMANRMSPTVFIKQSGMDDFEIETRTTVRNQEMSFKVGEVFRVTFTWERSDREVVAAWEGDRLTIRVVGDDDETLPVFERYIENDQLVLVQRYNGAECRRCFERSDI